MRLFFLKKDALYCPVSGNQRDEEGKRDHNKFPVLRKFLKRNDDGKKHHGDDIDLPDLYACIEREDRGKELVAGVDRSR
jgi:hypothetical protein